jgi:hypothetical protein
METIDLLNQDYKGELDRARIWASVEENTRWRVTCFSAMSDLDRKKDADNYLNVGDVIALCLSEM